MKTPEGITFKRVTARGGWEDMRVPRSKCRRIMTLLLSMNVEKPYNFVYVNYYYGGQWVHSDTYKNVTDSSRARLLKIWGQHLESEAAPLRKATMKGNGDCVGVALSVVVPMKRR